MKTIDEVISVIAHNMSTLKTHLTKKDKKILLSFHKQLLNGLFLTKKQSVLLVNILKENIEAVKISCNEIEKILELNQWSRDFRILKHIKKIYVDPNDSKYFIVEFSYNPKFRSSMSKISTKLHKHISVDKTKHKVFLCEANLYNVVKLYKKENFNIEPKLLEYYDTISEIKKTTEPPFEIFSTEHEDLKNAVKEDIGEISKDNLLLLTDRRFRYQYQINEMLDDNTTNGIIALRPNKAVHINHSSLEFVDLIKSLVELKRFPVLFIFDGNDPLADLKRLDEINNAREQLNLNDTNVGIYFRYETGELRSMFNEKIADLKYNSVLDDSTQFVGISNRKIPKFMIKMNWKPATVVAFTNRFRNTIPYVYCSNVDLVVYYTNSQPLDTNIHALM